MLTRRILRSVQQSAVGMATLTQCSVLFVAKHSAPSHSGRFKIDLQYATPANSTNPFLPTSPSLCPFGRYTRIASCPRWVSPHVVVAKAQKSRRLHIVWYPQLGISGGVYLDLSRTMDEASAYSALYWGRPG
jgi:hypothetical protein